MAEANLDRLVRSWERMRADRSTWDSGWQEIADYLAPVRSNITVQRTPGEKQTTNIFDSEGVLAPQLLAASMHGTLTSSSQKWFSLVVRQEDVGKAKDVQDWLEENADRTYFAFNASNFPSEVHEVYNDLTVFGTGALFMEEARAVRPGAFAGFRFKALPIGAYCIDENYDGRVEILYRQFELSAWAAVQQWGRHVGDAILRYADQTPERMVKIIHAVSPRQGKDRIPGVYVNSSKPYASCYFSLEGQKHKIAEGGFDEFPFMVPRWSKSSGERYGRGPGHTALPDIKTLNRAVEIYLGAGAKALDPPLLVLDDGVTGSLSLEPAAWNVVREMGAVAPLESKAKFDVAQIMFERLERKIRRAFFTDQLQLQEGPNMTATEVTVRYELMQRLLGPTLGRLQTELLQPLIERALRMQARAQVLPPIPQTLAQFGGDIDIEYEGPLARAQRSHDLVAIERWFSMMAAASQATASTEVFDNVRMDEVIRHVASVVGVPSDLIEDPRVMQRARQVRQQAAAQAQQMAQMKELTEGIRNVAPAMKALPAAAQVIEGEAVPA